MTPGIVKALVLGSSGMLGSGVARVITNMGIEIIRASRSDGLIFDALLDPIEDLIEQAGLSAGDYVLNCIGLTKSHITGTSPAAVMAALELNAVFPLRLSRIAETKNLKVVQIATDCVFSGLAGKYNEASLHDATDIYGKTKSLGEAESNHVMHIRTSLVGPEQNGRQSLFFDWVRRLEEKSEPKGYLNHIWNGVTSLTAAKILGGIVSRGYFEPGVQHLVPADQVTKLELMQIELDFLQRTDVKVVPHRTEVSVDRSLATINPHKSELLFSLGGYSGTPSIHEMMEELPWVELRTS